MGELPILDLGVKHSRREFCDDAGGDFEDEKIKLQRRSLYEL